ncbi:MarR family winged helix-turn-helix transcriptional regulator [Actinoallomurus iriomotensis]|uniref:MarR family transcriptional regulator n=1 Tax=Actinoallomurus iriomotensis TaxID=478107 RepID=A0A9W6W2V4_9ACTN|nr:MarR family transcriptional regulator [Actinoallomurus iriomotensis]GLY89330.1 MarR family transcriptional regulator [Actinoallomurus iriomotensis]
MSEAEGERMGVATALVRSSFLVNAVYAESSREHGLTPQQGQLLCVLMPRPYGMSELGGVLGLAKSSLTGLVDRSAQRGLVRREPDPEDARAVRVALTSEGARLAKEFYAETTRRVESLAENLDETDRRVLSALLAEVVFDNKVPVVFMDFGAAPPTQS